jgi:hypothetical protein
VFVRNGTTWTQQAYIKASNAESSDSFGGNNLFGFGFRSSAIALSGDTLVVGAPGEASASTGINGNQFDNFAMGSGAAYVFVRSGSTWTQEAYVKASNTGDMDRFGSVVAIHGNTLAIGAPNENSSATGINGNQFDNMAMGSGAVYAFTRSGTTWMQAAYVKASNNGPFASSDFFGRGVALDADTLAVGAPNEASNATGINGNQSNNSFISAGAVYVIR